MFSYELDPSFDNTDGICRTNFNLEAMSRFAWGRGIYLSKVSRWR